MAQNHKNTKAHLLDYIRIHPLLSSSQIHEAIKTHISYATAKRMLQELMQENLIEAHGKGKATKYQLSVGYEILHEVNVDAYFKKEIDERKVRKSFNHDLINDSLSNASLFTKTESERLDDLHKKFIKKVKEFNKTEYKNAMERLAIDLSWKSSQIEGNTYTLLETERLLKEKETAAGKTKDEASMLLNHKEAIDFIIAHPGYVHPLSVALIENIHGILVKELPIDRNIRKRSVTISGTNYKPIDNEFQIRQALDDMCKLVNKRQNVFEKAFLTLMLISYIQPFVDGNKRTARIMSNALLIHFKYCPLSFRTVDSLEYKKAMLVFYEQNNVSAFKKIFMEQYEFAVETYF